MRYPRVTVGRARVLCVACATVAVLAGCAGGQPASSAAQSPGAAQATAGAQLAFASKTLDGRDFSGQSLAGKAAVLWFWAPWCPKCQREAPAVAHAAQANTGKVTFVGVAAQDQLAAMQGFVTNLAALRRHPAAGLCVHQPHRLSRRGQRPALRS